MFRNYFTIALRNLLKYKAYSLINVAGLAVGMACFALIGLFVWIELSYDTFHEKANRIYRVVKEDPGNFYLDSNHYAVTPVPLAPALKADFPEIVQSTAIDRMEGLLGNGELKAFEQGIWADENFFDVFTYPLIQGDPKTALAEPNAAVLSESLARKYFGDQDPMGKTLMFQNTKTLLVTGVMQDPPKHAHFTFDYIVSLSTSEQYNRNIDEWRNNSWHTYFVLADGGSIEGINARLSAFTKTHLADSFQNDPERMSRYYVQPLTDIHLHSHLNFEIGQNGDIKYVYMFSVIAVVILLIACVNYMNLATARASTRFREAGVRKVMGAHRSQLIVQFLGESIVLSCMAAALAGIVVVLLLPAFSTLVDRVITLDQMRHWPFAPGLIVVGLLVGVISGSYPALMLSAANPARILRAAAKRGAKRAALRNILVTAQFTATIVLIVGTVVVQRQLDYMRTAETGVDRDHVVVVPLRGQNIRGQYDALRQALLINPNIMMVTSSAYAPTRISDQTTVRRWDGNDEERELPIYNAAVNYDYIEMFGIELVEGRAFSKAFATDIQGAMLLNETAIRQMGWDSAAGKRFEFWGSESKMVIGVMKDFHFQPFHQKIEPLLLYLRPDNAYTLLVKIDTRDIPETLAFLEHTMRSFSPDYPFEYEFLDDAFNRMYRTEARLGQIFSLFTGIALTIACLGLFGLAAFMAEQRTKEIGVRKVLGASIPDILWLMLKDFTVLVVLSFGIGVPVAYYAMGGWLQDFAYRIDLGADIFAFAGLLTFLIAWATVSWQSVKAARANPVESLRYE